MREEHMTLQEQEALEAVASELEEQTPKQHRSLLSKYWRLWLGILAVSAYLLLDVSGVRAYTTILSGTAPTDVGSQAVASTFGIVYTLLYFFVVVIVPPLLFTEAGLFVLDRKKV